MALLSAGAGAAVLAVGLGGFFLGQATAEDGSDGERKSDSVAAIASPLTAAYDACEGRDSDNTLSLEDGVRTIVVDTRSEYGNPAGMACVLKKLETPQSVTAQIDRTTSMMGVQDAEDDGIEYSWSYHPDNGVNMVITTDGSN